MVRRRDAFVKSDMIIMDWHSAQTVTIYNDMLIQSHKDLNLVPIVTGGFRTLCY